MKSYSFSSLSGFKNCPKAFELRYIKKIPEAFQSVEAFMGNIVHSVIETIYKNRDSGPVPEQNELSLIYRKIWDNRDKSRVKVIREEKTLQFYLDLGLEMAETFFSEIFGKDKSETLSLEQKFEVELSGGKKYRGIMDRVSRLKDGTLRITDFKTGTVGEPGDTIQLPSYAIYIFKNNIENEIELCYEDLKLGKTKVSGIKRDEIKVIRSKIEDSIDIIEKETNFNARPSSLCKWCGYNEMCTEYLELNGEDVGNSHYCPDCGSKLIKRKGKFGSFLGCSGYPECKYTFDLGKKDEEPDENMVCPECGNPLRERNGKFGKFLGCSNYPECRFTRKIKPV
ncbi:MAG: topoisomerase DNA-binding C4 zinc finger domain-containing protein [Acidobacteriota bacterium]